MLARKLSIPAAGAVAWIVLTGLGASRSPREATSGPNDLRLSASSIRSALDRANLSREERSALDALYSDAAISGTGTEATLWSRDGRLQPEAGELLSELEASGDRGLEPDAYRPASLARALLVCEGATAAHASVRERLLADCDVALTRRFLEVSNDLAYGRVERVTGGLPWYAGAKTPATEPRLDEALRAGVGPALDALEPRDRGYRALVAARAGLLELEAEGGWTTLPSDPRELATLPDGRTRLATRLAVSGDLDPRSLTPGESLAGALARFQSRHGLEATGEVDRATLAAMNVPVAERLRQVELNLERWRWLPAEPEGRHVTVNIPAYELELVDGDDLLLAMPVIVGKPSAPTPVLTEEIQRIELNPYWNVPPSIAEAEILPAIEKDPTYLEKENLEFVPAGGDRMRIRQRPGAANSLGFVKFVLPNPHNIYLHDTPADRLFARRVRALSHGCVRLSRPQVLAAKLLENEPGWTAERIQAEIDRGENRSVPLSVNVPVRLVYRTAWVDRSGRLQFRPDPYGADSALADALAERAAGRDEPLRRT